MKLGFAIDHRRCIGCHACTVACKAENEVPVGSFRTWVKYVEKGAFPAVRRHFTVLRCNHCDAAPCVEICPVVALYKRPDAIVDLDRDVCIGCRACMQACPYDALYINEDSGVAEKCHFCAHRTELGLEPACVVVCPEEAIVSGDTDDPGSDLSRLIAAEPTSRRRLDKGTEPRVWYVDALEESLVPSGTRQPRSWLWSDRRLPPPPVPPEEERAPPDVVTTLDVSHLPAWGWHIWTYMTTKNVSAGAALVAPFLAPAGMAAGFARDVVPELVALVFLGITGFLLVHDLGRPARFLRILTHPNPRSWLVKGTWVLTGFGGLAAASLVLRAAGLDGAADALRWANLPFAVLASGYTAFLFGQCRGRDLWLERGLFWNLVARAALFGAALGMVLAVGGPADADLARTFLIVLLTSQMLVVWEYVRKPRTESARLAHEILKRDQSALLGLMCLVGAILCVAPGLWGGAARGAFSETLFQAAALVFVGAGTWLLERAWVRAGQAVPNS